MKSANINAYLSIFKNFIITKTVIRTKTSLKAIPPRLKIRKILLDLFFEYSQKTRKRRKFISINDVE